MDSPQTEDGYTEIADELIEAFAKIRISGEEMQVLWVIIRKTYGYKKKFDWISLTQFVERTGIKKPNVVRAIRNLLSKKIITVINNDNGMPQRIGINKYYGTWRPLSKKITAVINNDTHNKDSYKKQKDIKKYVASDTPYILSKSLILSIKTWMDTYNYPTDSAFQTWCLEIDKMIRIDKRTESQVKTVIDWLPKDDFWRSNILSGAKLRKQFDTLEANRISKSTPKHQNETDLTDPGRVYWTGGKS